MFKEFLLYLRLASACLFFNHTELSCFSLANCFHSLCDAQHTHTHTHLHACAYVCALNWPCDMWLVSTLNMRTESMRLIGFDQSRRTMPTACIYCACVCVWNNCNIY